MELSIPLARWSSTNDVSPDNGNSPFCGLIISRAVRNDQRTTSALFVDLHRQICERRAAVVADEPRVLHVEARLSVLRDRMRVHRQDHPGLQLGLDAFAD